jgi:protein TonB
VISVKIKKSSTYEVLDNEALEMIKKASPFPAPPESLRGKNFNVLVPISFKLE